jgi:hypothetical protein
VDDEVDYGVKVRAGVLLAAADFGKLTADP